VNKATDIKEDPLISHNFKTISLKRRYQAPNMIVATDTTTMLMIAMIVTTMKGLVSGGMNAINFYGMNSKLIYDGTMSPLVFETIDFYYQARNRLWIFCSRRKGRLHVHNSPFLYPILTRSASWRWSWMGMLDSVASCLTIT